MALKANASEQSSIRLWTQFNDRGITHPIGFKAAAVRAGLKSKGEDIALIVSDAAASVAGVFTTNLFQASCVVSSREVVSRGVAQAIFCNSGNANACTGHQGEQDNRHCASLTARALGMSDEHVVVASTGVIGRPLDMVKISGAVPLAAESLDKSCDADLAVARAIMTTDTRPKQIAIECQSPSWEGVLRIGGVAKGSGMIAPNMATTLCFLTTDANIEPSVLQLSLNRAIDKTFNRLTVDGDTSTNDMAVILANGLGPSTIDGDTAAFADFAEALERVCLALAKEVARDGEGATKLVWIKVTNAVSEAHAAKVAKTIAESPLVKTALFGSDPNWGRIVAAAGRAGVPLDPNRMQVYVGSQIVFDCGSGVAFDRETAHRHLKGSEVSVVVSLGSGAEEATVWTCDYSYDYIKINAEYHT